MKYNISEEIQDYYTDILSHGYEPRGFRMVAGTTTGKIVVLQ